MPRKKSKVPPHGIDNLHSMPRESFDMKHLLRDIAATCRSGDSLERLWSVDQTYLVSNAELEDRYERRRHMLRHLGRTAEETQDTLMFVAEGWGNVFQICRYGMRCCEKKRHVLGDTEYGAHVSMHYDILLRFMAFKNFRHATNIIVFKGMLGRVRTVKAKLRGEYGSIAPTPNFDCHLSDVRPDFKMEIGDAFAHNFAYMYEFDEETILPVMYPSHLLPIAVITLNRTRNKLKRHKSWFTGRKSAVSGNSITQSITKRKTILHSKARRKKRAKGKKKNNSKNKKSISLEMTNNKEKEVCHTSTKNNNDSQTNKDSSSNYEQRNSLQDGVECFLKDAMKSSALSLSEKDESSQKGEKSSSPNMSNDGLLEHSSDTGFQHFNADGGIMPSASEEINQEATKSQSTLTDKIHVKTEPVETETSGISSSVNKNIHARKNLFDLFDMNKSNEEHEVEDRTAKADFLQRKGKDANKKCETIFVKVFDQSDSDNDDEKWDGMSDSDNTDVDEMTGQLQNEIDPECSKLLARLQEVEHEINNEQEKLCNLENIPNVLDSMLQNPADTIRSGSSTPTLDEPSYEPSGVRSTVIQPIERGLDFVLNMQIKTERKSPSPTILSPSCYFDESRRRLSSIQMQNIVSNSNDMTPQTYRFQKLPNETNEVNKSIYNNIKGINTSVKTLNDVHTKHPTIQQITSSDSRHHGHQSYSDFDSILSRIKKEPREDKGYGRLSHTSSCRSTETSRLAHVKQSVNAPSVQIVSSDIQNVQTTGLQIRNDGSNGQTKTQMNAKGEVQCSKKFTEKDKGACSKQTVSQDEVEKTLRDLGKVIKVMQHQLPPLPDCNDKKNEKIDYNVKGNNSDFDQFRPRNMGFSSYLPEYNNGNDYFKTSNFLKNAFSSNKSQSGKEPMSSGDHFGVNSTTNELDAKSVDSNIHSESKESNVESDKVEAIKRKKKDHHLNKHESKSPSKGRKLSPSNTSSLSKSTERKLLKSSTEIEKSRHDKQNDHPQQRLSLDKYGRVCHQPHFDINTYNSYPDTTPHFENNRFTGQSSANSLMRKRPFSPGTSNEHSWNQFGDDINDFKYQRLSGQELPRSMSLTNMYDRYVNVEDHYPKPNVPRYTGLVGPNSATFDTRNGRKPGLLGEKPGDYNLTGSAAMVPSSESQTKQDDHLDSALSKAMTSLLRRIVYNDQHTSPKTTEDQMAEIVLEMMKQQIKKEEAQNNVFTYPYCMEMTAPVTHWPLPTMQYLQGLYGHMWQTNQVIPSEQLELRPIQQNNEVPNDTVLDDRQSVPYREGTSHSSYDFHRSKSSACKDVGSHDGSRSPVSSRSTDRESSKHQSRNERISSKEKGTHKHAECSSSASRGTHHRSSASKSSRSSHSDKYYDRARERHSRRHHDSRKPYDYDRSKDDVKRY